MLDKRNITVPAAFLVMTAFFAQPALAHVETKNHYSYQKKRNHPQKHTRHYFKNHRNVYRSHNPSPVQGKIVVSLPGGFISVTVGGKRYHYCDGVFYRKRVNDYIVVAPPAGAVVLAPPTRYSPVIINGVTYYTADGVYYQYTPQGYIVVPEPTVNALESVKVISTGPLATTSDIFTVNIPNSLGGYTAVTLKRSGGGFTGPQGEFYPQFPTVSQLQVMYFYADQDK